MRLKRVTAVAGAAALVAGLAVTTEAASAAPGKKFTIKLSELITKYDDTYGADQIPEKGDSFSFRGRLFRGGERAGSDKGSCTWLSFDGPDELPTGATLRCKVTLKLDGGKIKVRGTQDIDFEDPATSETYKIVGGTGRYEGAKGKLKNVALDDTKSRLVLKFRA